MKALVTGASGFVGGAVCAQLQADGHEVVALVRREGSQPAGTTPVRGDLTDAGSLRRALGDHAPDWVFHLAAELASARNDDRVRQVNEEGTRRLLDAALPEDGERALPKVIFASTVVTGDANGALLTEDRPLPVATVYGKSKQACEHMLRASGLPFAIVRPGHVYGPGGWYAEKIVKRLQQPGRLAVVGRGDNLWDVVQVEDVAAALVAAAERGGDSALFHVADDEPLTLYDFVKLTADALGVGPPRRTPAFLAQLVAGRNAVLAAARSARTSNAKLKRELGWSPRFPNARVGVPDAVAQLRGN
ncbi:MAG TPA: NAD(P)-dependent oxidoreductase [Solirubrobacteraceae bacterium]|jgi:nucleoside-diphosphate-sugar epimerase|nr:NAD(P)-dependent oxidoreductase [Solirubrobacteraceae bacterium]